MEQNGKYTGDRRLERQGVTTTSVNTQHCTHVHNPTGTPLKCINTNVDLLFNKRSELDVIISMHQPDMIGITKTLQKNRDMDPEENEFHIQGYDRFNNLGKLCKRGVIPKYHPSGTTGIQ